MSDETSASSSSEIDSVKAGFSGLARWKKIAAVLAVLLLVGGAVLKATGGGDAPASTASGALPGHSFLGAGSSASPASAEPSPGDEYGPALMKVGLGFLVGLSIGVFLRSSLRLALVFFGLFALAVLGLEQIGLVTVHWDLASEGFENAKGALGEQFASFKSFIEGQLPGGGAGAAGLYSGFRRS